MSLEQFNSYQQDTKSRIDSLAKAVESLNVEHKSSNKGIVSISVGIHFLIPCQDDKINNVIELADNALYQSKEAGRDRVTLSSQG